MSYNVQSTILYTCGTDSVQLASGVEQYTWQLVDIGTFYNHMTVVVACGNIVCLYRTGYIYTWPLEGWTN